MALEKQSKTIGEFTYDVTSLGAKVGNRVLMKLAKSVGPAFLLAAGGGAKGIDVGRASEAIREMNEDDFEWIVQQFATKTDVTLADGRSPSLGNPAMFDMHFAGLYAEELQWLEFCIEVNFGPFFLALKQKAAAATKQSAVATPAASS